MERESNSAVFTVLWYTLPKAAGTLPKLGSVICILEILLKRPVQSKMSEVPKCYVTSVLLKVYITVTSRHNLAV